MSEESKIIVKREVSTTMRTTSKEQSNSKLLSNSNYRPNAKDGKDKVRTPGNIVTPSRKTQLEQRQKLSEKSRKLQQPSGSGKNSSPKLHSTSKAESIAARGSRTAQGSQQSKLEPCGSRACPPTRYAQQAPAAQQQMPSRLRESSPVKASRPPQGFGRPIAETRGSRAGTHTGFVKQANPVQQKMESRSREAPQRTQQSKAEPCGSRLCAYATYAQQATTAREQSPAMLKRIPEQPLTRPCGSPAGTHTSFAQHANPAHQKMESRSRETSPSRSSRSPQRYQQSKPEPSCSQAGTHIIYAQQATAAHQQVPSCSRGPSPAMFRRISEMPGQPLTGPCGSRTASQTCYAQQPTAAHHEASPARTNRMPPTSEPEPCGSLAGTQTSCGQQALAAHQQVPSCPCGSRAPSQTSCGQQATSAQQQVSSGSRAQSPARSTKEAQLSRGAPQTPSGSAVTIYKKPKIVQQTTKVTRMAVAKPALPSHVSTASLQQAAPAPTVGGPFGFITPVLSALFGRTQNQGAQGACTALVTTKPNAFYYSTQLKRYEELHSKSCHETDKLGMQLNMVFLRRLLDIESKAMGDEQLTIITYSEWVDALNKCISDTAMNMEFCRSEINQLLEEQYRKMCTSNDQVQTANSEVTKLTCDIELLKQALCNAYQNDDWDMSVLPFQTLDGAVILGDCFCRKSSTRSIGVLYSDAFQSEAMEAEHIQCPRSYNESADIPHDMAVNAKALAIEIANKHDENCLLKRQLNCLEDDVQKAQQKLQLKDDVIAKLREDLKWANAQVLEEQPKLQLKDDLIAKLCEDLKCANAQVLEEQQKLQCKDDKDDIIAKLREDLNCAHAQVLEEQQKLQCKDAKDDIIAKLREDLKCANAQVLEEQQKLQLKDDIIAELRENLKCPSAQVSEEQQKLQCKDDFIAKLQEDLRTVNVQLLAQQQKLKCKDSVIATLREDFSSARAQLLEQQQKLKRKDDIIAMLREDVSRTNAQCSEMNRNHLSSSFQLVDLCASGASEASARRSKAGCSFCDNYNQDPQLDTRHPPQNFECALCVRDEERNEVEKIRLFLSDLEFDMANDVNLRKCDSDVSGFEQDNSHLDATRRRWLKFKEDFRALLQREERSAQILQELADHLVVTTQEVVRYYDNYNASGCKRNPFIQAISELRYQHEERVRKLDCVISELRNRIQFLEDKLNGETSNQRQEAGDCPHRSQLETTLRQCQSHRAVITDTHVDYLSIINELKCDLEVISQQVSKVQDDFAEQGIEPSEQLEKSLKELETHNALLQQRLESTEKFKDAVCIENVACKEQIRQLESKICEKDDCISQLSARLGNQRNQCKSECDKLRASKEEELRQLRDELDASCRKIECLNGDLEESRLRERYSYDEARRLNDELVELKRKHSELQAENKRLGLLLQNHEANRQEQMRKSEDLESAHEAASKKLRVAARELNSLQDRYCQLAQQAQESEQQRISLHDEIVSLKEMICQKFGENRALKDQMKNLENEMRRIHEHYNTQIIHLQVQHDDHQKQIFQLMECNKELKMKLQCAYDNISDLEAEFNAQKDILCKKEELIQSYQSWKDAQLKADEVSTTTREEYEEHIRYLLEDRQNFVDSYRTLTESYNCIQEELRRASIRASSPGLPLTPTNPMNARLEFVRHTSSRLASKADSIRREDMDNMPGTSSKYQQ